MKKRWYMIAVLCIAVSVVIACAAFVGNKKQVPKEVGTSVAATEAPQPTAEAPNPTERPGVTIEMAYGSKMYVSEEYAANLLHEQEIHGSMTTDVFSMLIGDTKTAIYRVDFGTEEAGDWLGILKTEDGDVIVTYTVFYISREELEVLGESASEIYYVLMDSFNDALNEISADSRFIAEKQLDLGEDQQAEMTYWTVTLPGIMTWTETTEDGDYQVTFYGAIQGESTALYTVCISDDATENALGLFNVNGENKTISVESYDLDQQGTWTDEDFSTAYRMMETINDVIQQIISSDLYSEFVPEEIPAEAGNG